MEHSADSPMSSIHTGVGGSALDPDLPEPLDCGQSNRDGAVLLQLREFKTHLLEAVEELRVWRDAEARFEERISKLVSEKQELQWAKETLQHQSETVAKQHTESLNSVKKQFQAKIKNVEEEKGKYEVSVEIKNKEINSLKEELKSLQLLKVNLEKRISELEQTLLLQNKANGSQLTKLGEVEKRFSVLSRKCAIVTQAHEKLQQNVDEATKRNEQLASANAKQEEVIASLKKETKMMKTFMEENAALTQEKLEVVRSLQQTHQLLLSQTQAVSRAELELQTKAEQDQALKQEHEVMREKSKALEDKLAQLTEKYAACKRDWDKEKAVLLEHIKKAQQDLHPKHNEPSWQVQVQVQDKTEKRGSSQSCGVSTQLLPAEGLEDSRAGTKLAGLTEGQNTFNHHQQSQFKPVNHQNQFTSTPDSSTIQHFSGSLANQRDPDTTPTSASNMNVREMDQTADHANGSKDSQISREDAKNSQEPGIPMKDRGDGEETDGREERRGHALQKPKY